MAPEVYNTKEIPDGQSTSRQIDVALCAVPQWSPFQPSLSLPSLAAWIRRESFDCTLFDESLEFYEFLLSERAVSALKCDLSEAESSSSRMQAAINALECWPDFRRDLDVLRAWNDCQPRELEARKSLFARDTYRATKSLETYLRYVSTVSNGFTISPYDFRLKGGSLRRTDIEEFISDPPPVISRFIEESAKRILRSQPRCVGLSCIGQEQLIFTLMTGAAIKKRSGIPVIIGGTVFSRLAERGVVPTDWFATYFDVIVRNEGEIPLIELLRCREFLPVFLKDVPGLIYLEEGEIVTTRPPVALQSADLPVPDFHGLPLSRYMTGRVVLPILSSRGCYWGKCEFCHHGMVYGEKYQSYKSTDVKVIVEELAKKYSVQYFSFNDEALPPSLLRKVTAEWSGSLQMYFTGLMKFEKFFARQDFERAYDMGFRALYVGLESASERVLVSMRKNTSKDVMIRNLADATAVGISMHCFLFFGFPGEEHADAVETINFVIDHANIIGSYGAGVFSLEHNAPIMQRLADHGVTLVPLADDELDIYYRYNVDHGIGQEEASLYVDRLVTEASFQRKFRLSSWIPREYLLVLRSLFSEREMIDQCDDISATYDIGIFEDARDEWSLNPGSKGEPGRLISRLNGCVLEVQGETQDILRRGLADGRSARVISDELPWVEVAMASRS